MLLAPVISPLHAPKAGQQACDEAAGPSPTVHHLARAIAVGELAGLGAHEEWARLCSKEVGLPTRLLLHM